MPLLPVLPVLLDESLASYLSRIARVHGNMDFLKFLAFIELSQGALMAPKSETFARLEKLLRISTSDLERMTFRSLGGRVRSLCGEELHAEFANLEKTSFCPACLLEDGQEGSLSSGCRVGRVSWQIEPVRTCARHGIGLVRRKNSARVEKLQVMSFVAPSDEVLTKLVAEAIPQDVSDLQSYIVRRLAGESGPAWLDGQPIDLAARACEMLGIILTSGTHVNLKLLTEAKWNDAGHVGFKYASKGEEGIREFLTIVLEQFAKSGLRGGPQKVFGRLYQWLQFNKNSKPVGPIRGIMREFIQDHFPIEPGADLFGEPVDRRRVHSIYSLAKKTGDHPKTINRAVVHAGLMDGDPEIGSAVNAFDANEGEMLMARIRTSITVKALEKHLNCNRVQAEQLTRSGLIPRLLPDEDKATGVLKNIALEDADSFLERLMATATIVEAPSANVTDIVSAAEISRWPAIDIVQGILVGLFETVEVLNPDLKFKGILVDPMEVRKVLSQDRSEGRMGLEDAARTIGMPPHGLSALAKMRRSDGTAYVTEYYIENAKKVRIRLYSEKELLAFRSEHISLKEIADRRQLSPKVMRKKLDEKGVSPLAAKYQLGRIWYRRSDLTDF